MSVTAASVAYATVGGLVLYSGIKGASLAATAKGVLSGNLSLTDTQVIGTPSIGETGSSGNSSPTAPASASNSAIVADAMKYVGNKYVWGGTPGTTKGHNNGTDCSGFVNMVIGRDLGLAIPGEKAGAYKGATHGPTTQVWLLWGGCKTVSSAQPGDLACFLTHIGIFTDDGAHMVSALDTQSGVIETTIAGGTPTGEKLTIRRLNA
jgi:cell wall-associated NlpC family hydrolase